MECWNFGFLFHPVEKYHNPGDKPIMEKISIPLNPNAGVNRF
jgi:hypothetical protein